MRCEHDNEILGLTVLLIKFNLIYVKVMRCEHDNETLGLTVLDEPAALQSDPTILDLQVGFKKRNFSFLVYLFL